MVTIRDVAELAGVSIATVSRVLSKSDYPVSHDTRQKIINAAKELGYSVNRAAQSLRTDRSSVIGVILENFTSLWGPLIIRGLQDVLHRNGYFCLVVNIPWEIHSQAKVVQELLGHSVDGFVFVESWRHVSESRAMLSGKPYTIVHRLFHQTDVNSVIPDEIYNTTLVVNHLIKMRHQRIGYISGPDKYFSSRERLIGYLQTLESMGLSVDKTLIRSGRWLIPDGYRIAQEFMALSKPPTAIVAANDLMAYGAILAIQHQGLRVPDDIAVVGYDNDEVANLSNPTITTVSLPLFEMGQVAATNLMNQMNDGAVPFEEMRIKGELMVRQSCGAPEGKNILAANYIRNSTVEQFDGRDQAVQTGESPWIEP